MKAKVTSDRFAGLRMQRRKLPAGYSIREFVIRELTGRDEIEAAKHAELSLDVDQKGDVSATLKAETRERVRLSLMEVDGRPVNHDGVPFVEMDNWTSKTRQLVTYAFNQLNGVQDEDLKKFEADVEELSGPPARTSESSAFAED